MKRFIRSFVFALAGIRDAVKSELSLKLHLLAVIAAVTLGIYLGISEATWAFIILAIGGVLAAELFNTAIERLGDEAAEGKTKLNVKKAKDAAAGAVLISALAALAVGIIFLVIPLINKILK